MTKLSKNFSLNELTYSSTARANKVDNIPDRWELENLKKLCNEVLQPIRDKYGKSIFINSGYRNPIVNRLVNGSSTSQHMKGEAADITVGSKEGNKKLFEMIVEMIENGEIKVGQLIDEKKYSWIHISLPFSKTNQILHLK
jgi:uncharacterized protein YcbK (DUF882 family)